MSLRVGRYFKMTLKTRILLWLYHHYPRLDQWFIKHCDEYPEGYDPFKQSDGKENV